jgi:hypothetical protein
MNLKPNLFYNYILNQMSKKISLDLFENVYPILPKGKVLSHKGKMFKKRQLKEDEVLVNYMIAFKPFQKKKVIGLLSTQVAKWN